MKTPEPKTDLRAEIEAQTQAYLERGGAVKAIARGMSGRDDGREPLAAFRNFTPRPREERTYVPDVVAAIEARRKQPKPKHKPRPSKATGFVRKPVLDDFGEPIRWEWVER